MAIRSASSESGVASPHHGAIAAAIVKNMRAASATVPAGLRGPRCWRQ
jgi:hypothetical protein